MSSDSPVIITAALVGAELTRQDTPYLPITPDEISDAAIEAWRAGAAMVHLHVRDETGNPTCREDVFQKVIGRIRRSCDVIIQVSTGGAIGDSEADRVRPLQARPEMASLSMGSINFGRAIFSNPQPFIEKLAVQMKQCGVRPELEVFDVAMLENALRMVQTGWLTAPLHIDLVFGVPGALAATERNLDFLVASIPPDYSWSVTAVGRHEFPMAQLALKKGGHVRVGLEDNIYLEKGVLAESSAQLVEQVVGMAREVGRPIATVPQAREILRLI
jgi:3-keto-5-aminohexanoate cleavage enzyme